MKVSKRELNFIQTRYDIKYPNRQETRFIEIDGALGEDEELKVYAVKKEPRTIEEFVRSKGWTEREFLDKFNAWMNEDIYIKTFYSYNDVEGNYKQRNTKEAIRILKDSLK
jgi:hypothetical protein